VADTGTTHIQAYHKGVLSTTLAALTGSASGHSIVITGHTTAGDGGEGIARWDASDSSTTDNGGTVWGAGTGRWKRVYDGSTVDPAWFGTITGSATAAIQAALDTGKHVDLKGRSYSCANLTASGSRQRIFSSAGLSVLTKNANGPIISHSGTLVVFDGIDCVGVSGTYTGDNISLTGYKATLTNVRSVGAAGLALKSTQETHIIGGNYNTAGVLSTDYDIELGGLGAGNLYSTIMGVSTNQHTGGVHLVDCGVTRIIGNEIGSLYIEEAGGGTGVGNSVIGNRIHRDITVETSNNMFSANLLGASCDVTFAAGIAGNVFDATNVLDSGATIISAANGAQLIERSVGAAGSIQLRYGDDNARAYVWQYEVNSDLSTHYGNLRMLNNFSLQMRNAANAAHASLYMSAADIATWAYTGVAEISASSGLLVDFWYGQATLSAAAAGTQAAGTACNRTYNRFSTVGGAGYSGTLPSAAAGRMLWVVNAGANDLALFPAVGDNIEGAAVDASITLAAGVKAHFWAIDATTWVRLV
jgi:hypothetical protein